jgi:hypothetical protein
MAVESKSASDALSLHEGERDAIGETDLLIRILLEKQKSFVLVGWSGAEYLKGSMHRWCAQRSAAKEYELRRASKGNVSSRTKLLV